MTRTGSQGASALVRAQPEVEVGRFTLRPFLEGSVWLENEEGEGMQISSADFEKVLADYWEKNF